MRLLNKPKPIDRVDNPLSIAKEDKSLLSLTYKYREYIPQELPEDFRKFTPEWLYSRIDWRLQARHLEDMEPGTWREKLKIGLTVGVIAIGAVLMLCLVAIATDGG